MCFWRTLESHSGIGLGYKTSSSSYSSHKKNCWINFHKLWWHISEWRSTSHIVHSCQEFLDTLWMPHCFSLFDGRITVFAQTVHLFWIEVSKTVKINTVNFKIQSVCRRWSQRRVCKSEWRRLSVSWRSLILLLKECHGSLLLLKQHPVTDPKPLTEELIKLMCDTPPPPWHHTVAYII